MHFANTSEVVYFIFFFACELSLSGLKTILDRMKKVKDSDGKFNEPNDYCSYLWDKSVLQRKLHKLRFVYML